MTTSSQSTTEPELKPCRCGRKALIERFHDGDDPQPLFVATCEVCPVKTYDQFTADEAARVWNEFVSATVSIPDGQWQHVQIKAGNPRVVAIQFETAEQATAFINSFAASPPSAAPVVDNKDDLDTVARRAAERAFAIMEHYCACTSSIGVEPLPLLSDDLAEIQKRRASMLFPDGRPTGPWLDIDRLLAHAEALQLAVRVRTNAINRQLETIKELRASSAAATPAPVEQYYCPEHKYNPPPNSGLALCPQCEITALPSSASAREAAESAAREWMNTHHASFETTQKREAALAAIIQRHCFPAPESVEQEQLVDEVQHRMGSGSRSGC